MSYQIKTILVMALYYFYNFLSILIFVRCILSWFNLGRDNIIIRMVDAVTEPILSPIRKIIHKSPISGFMIDFSPVIALILLQIIFRLVVDIVASL
ncbi:MAG: YggT family protein [Lachnospirales bacterium]